MRIFISEPEFKSLDVTTGDVTEPVPHLVFTIELGEGEHFSACRAAVDLTRTSPSDLIHAVAKEVVFTTLTVRDDLTAKADAQKAKTMLERLARLIAE